MLMEFKRPGEALKEYEASLRVVPNRFNGLYGAARAAELAGDIAKAKKFYSTLISVCSKASGERPELRNAKKILAGK
jgi:hypothetical protein